MSRNEGSSHRRRAESPLLDNLVPPRPPKRRQSHRSAGSSSLPLNQHAAFNHLSQGQQQQQPQPQPHRGNQSPFHISLLPHPTQAHLRQPHSGPPISYPPRAEPPPLEWSPMTRPPSLMPAEVIDLTRESPSHPQRQRNRPIEVIDLEDSDEPVLIRGGGGGGGGGANGNGDEILFVSERRREPWPPLFGQPPQRPRIPRLQLGMHGIEPPLRPPSAPVYGPGAVAAAYNHRQILVQAARTAFRPPALNYNRVSPPANGVNADYKEPPPAKDGYTHSPQENDTLVCAECEHELGTESDKPDGSLVWSGKCGHCYCGNCAVKYQYRPVMSGGKKGRTRTARCIIQDCKINLATKHGIIKIHAL